MIVGIVVAIVVAAVAEAGAHRSASDSRPLPRGFAAFRLRFRLTGLTAAGKAKKNLQGIGQRSWQRTGRAAKCEEDKHLGGQWWRCTSEHRHHLLDNPPHFSFSTPAIMALVITVANSISSAVQVASEP